MKAAVVWCATAFASIVLPAAPNINAVLRLGRRSDTGVAAAYIMPC